MRTSSNSGSVSLDLRRFMTDVRSTSFEINGYNGCKLKREDTDAMGDSTMENDPTNAIANGLALIATTGSLQVRNPTACRDSFVVRLVHVQDRSRQSRNSVCIMSNVLPTLLRNKDQTDIWRVADVPCHEVCVCCTKLFRSVREVRRHTETCTDESERKMKYMKRTSDELRDFSDKQLDIALGESLSSQGKGKKRTWDEADMDTEVLGSQLKARRLDPAFLEPVNIQQPAPDKGAVGPTTELFSTFTTPVRDTMCLGTLQDQNQAMEATEGHVPALDLLEDFDAPLMQIMNGVPIFINQWAMDGHDGVVSSNDATAYQLS